MKSGMICRSVSAMPYVQLITDFSAGGKCRLSQFFDKIILPIASLYCVNFLVMFCKNNSKQQQQREEDKFRYFEYLSAARKLSDNISEQCQHK